MIKKKGFSTFQGVFRPTLLTILGVMLYLREGWIVGNAGLLGALLIIAIVYIITGVTAFSVSSIATNTRTGAGGVFSIISQSLGLEVGGAIGIPFFLAQSLSGAMYMHGFVEGWQLLFPNHETTYIVLILFFALFSLSYFNTEFAFKVQYIMLFVLVIALVSIFTGVFSVEQIHQPQLWGNFNDAGFWTLFAIFFPAGTGIMVGASMSGELKNSHHSIPRGTLLAWGVSLIVYTSIAIIYSLIATPEILRSNLEIGITSSPVSFLVIVGLLASCFSASLSSFSAAPRVIQALAEHKIVGLSKFLKKQTDKGEPKNAIIFTAVLVLITALLADLNTIAQILTMFFLITYFSINTILVIEQRLDMVSFRPTFSIPRFIPVIGSVFSFITILIINPLFGILALLFIVIIYYYLHQKKLVNPWDTVRSGVFFTFINWALKHINESDRYIKRSWKPDFLIFSQEKEQLESVKKLVCSIVSPQGSVQLITITRPENKDIYIHNKLLIDKIRKEENIFASCCNVVHEKEDVFDVQLLSNCISVTSFSTLHPNTLFYMIGKNNKSEDLSCIQNLVRINKIGLLLFKAYEQSQDIGVVNLWLRDQSPNWELGLRMTNFNYQLLIACQLNKNLKVKINIITVTSKEEYVEIARENLKEIASLARLKDAEVKVYKGQFLDVIEKVEGANLNIMGFNDGLTVESIDNTCNKLKSSCLFVLDSGTESAFA